MAVGIKTYWSPEDIQFILENHSNMSNTDIANALGKTLTVTRIKCYELGLKRMILEYFTPEQTQYVIDNYQTKGDFEIAKDMNQLYPKIKSWNKKMIEKKRRYLNLKRTPEQIKAIITRNHKEGLTFSIGQYNSERLNKIKEGTRRIWAGLEFIKINNKFIPYNRYLWELNNGPIPKDMIVRKTNKNLPNTIENLIIISKAEHATINSKIRLPKEYIEIQTLIKKLNK